MRKLMAVSAVMLVAVGAACAAPASTNIAVWYGTEATPLTYISGDGTIVAQKVIGCDYSTINDMDVLDSLTVYTNATVRKALVVGTTANIAGAITASNNLSVGGTTLLTGNAVASGTLNVAGAVTMSNNATVGGTLGVTGIATFTVAPNLTVETAAGAVAGSPDGFVNLPTGVTTNPIYINISLGGTNYCVPAFKLP
jgi:hypothetical protein